jgi:hypothetical protein
MWPSMVRADSDTVSAISRFGQTAGHQQRNLVLAAGERRGEPRHDDRRTCRAATYRCE